MMAGTQSQMYGRLDEMMSPLRAFAWDRSSTTPELLVERYREVLLNLEDIGIEPNLETAIADLSKEA